MITKDINGNTLSQTFINKIQDSVTPFTVRLMANGQELDGAIVRTTVTKGSVGDVNAFNVGAVVGSSVVVEIKKLTTQVKGEEIDVQIGLDSTYISLGLFTVTDVKQTIYSTTITAYGACVSKTTGAFTSPQDMTPPQALTIANIVAEIATETGVTVTLDNAIDDTAEFVMPMQNMTTYEALQAVCAAVGGYAVDTPDGNITIKLYDDTPTHTVTAGNMVKLPQTEETDFEITGVLVNTPAGEFGSQTTINLVTESTYLTADMFSDYESNIVGYTYRPATIGLSLGDPRIEGIDVLTVTNADNTSFVMPCHQVIHTFSGGLKTDVQSATATELENEIATPLPLSGQIGEAVETANEALAKAEEAVETKQYFWHTTSDPGGDVGAGSHITQVPQAEFLDDPDSGGANTLIDSLGMKIRKGTTTVAQFAEEEIDLGLDSENAAITMCKKRGSISTKYTEGFEFVESLPFYYQASTTKNGLTFTVDSSEGQVTVTGTATADTIYQVSNYIQTPDGNDYRLEGCPEGGSEDTFFLYAGRYDGYVWHADYGDSVMWHRSEGSVVLYIFVKQGVTMDNDFFPDIWRGVILRGVTLSLSNNAPDEDYSKSIEMYTHYGEEDTEDLQEAYFRLGLEETGNSWAELWLGDNFGINFADNAMVVEGDSVKIEMLCSVPSIIAVLQYVSVLVPVEKIMASGLNLRTSGCYIPMAMTRRS